MTITNPFCRHYWSQLSGWSPALFHLSFKLLDDHKCQNFDNDDDDDNHVDNLDDDDDNHDDHKTCSVLRLPQAASPGQQCR